MFRVEKQEYANKTFRMPLDLVRRLEQIAHEKDISVNQLVIRCCRYALDNLEEE
jgi:predicted HicB family RNase H-like nuclease